MTSNRQGQGSLINGESIQDTMVKKGEALFSEGDLEFARQMFLEVIEIDPERADAYNNLGCVHHAKGNLSRAEESFLTAYVLDRDYLSVVNNLADMYRETGNASREVYFRQEAVRLNDTVPAAWNALALCWLELGDIREVAAAFRQSLALDGSQKTIATLLAEVGEVPKPPRPAVPAGIAVEMVGG